MKTGGDLPVALGCASIARTPYDWTRHRRSKMLDRVEVWDIKRVRKEF